MTPPPPLDLDMLRRLAIEQPAAGVIRLLALAVSATFLLAVLDLVRRGRLKEEYTPIWVVVAAGLMVSAVWFDGVRLVTRAVGAWTPSSTLFLTPTVPATSTSTPGGRGTRQRAASAR